MFAVVCCNMVTLLLLHLVVALAVSNAACPNGWIHHDDSCYFFSDDFESWTGAQTMCKLLGGHLADIGDGKEDTYLRSETLKRGGVKGYWLDATDLPVEGEWTWMTSGQRIESQTYTNWSPNEPSNDNTDENCLTLWIPFSSRWNDYHCGNTDIKYICERSFQAEEIIG